MALRRRRKATYGKHFVLEMTYHMDGEDRHSVPPAIQQGKSSMKECLANQSVNEWLCQAVETRLLREAGGWEQGIRTQGWKASQVTSVPGAALVQAARRTIPIP